MDGSNWRDDPVKEDCKDLDRQLYGNHISRFVTAACVS
jgi:hypothetical protein